MGKRRSTYHDKGRIKSQSEYDQGVELKNLYLEAFGREECGFEETITALVKVLGFSVEVAKQRVMDWQTENKVYMPESDATKKKRWKRQESLEARFLKRSLSKEEYDKYKASKSPLKNYKEKTWQEVALQL